MDALRDVYESWLAYLNEFPNIVFAIIVFLVGWLVAALIARGIRGILAKTTWDDRLFKLIKVNEKYKSHIIISKFIFYILMIFVFIMFFNILGLAFVAEPIVNMMNTVTMSIPDILKAGLILLFAWVLATILSFAIRTGGRKIGIDRLLAKWKISDNAEDAEKTLHAAGRIVFYLVLLFFIPGVLGALHISAVSGPMSNMLDQLLAFIPRLFGAALIVLIGWIIAKIVREILTKFLQSIGLEKVAGRLGLSHIFKDTTLSAIIGTVAFILILIPTFISALETLNLKGISAPAISMLTLILSMIPNVIIGIVLVLIGVWLGRVVGNIVAQLLEKLGFNGIFGFLGVKALEPSQTTMTISQIVGRITQIVILLLFIVEALQIVKLYVLVGLVTAFLAYLPNLLVAVVIIGVGLFLGTFIQRIIVSIVQQSFAVLGLIAKYTIIVLSLFMALDQLGVASSIVNAAFILTLGGLALAFGLAFGLGGREFAANYLNKWQMRIESMKAADNKPSNDQRPE